MPQDKQLNYYQLLGIPKSATCNDVQKAYREQAKENHPDLFSQHKNKKKLKYFTN
jgi:DnaJ-class molecular chaperone